MDPNSPINPVNPNEQPAPQPQPAPAPEPQPAAQPIAPAESAPIAQPQPAQPVTQPVAPAKKSNKTLVIILCAIIGIVAIAAVVMFILMNKQPQSTSSNNNTNNTSNTSGKDCGNGQNILGIWEQVIEGPDYTISSPISYVYKPDGTGVVISGAYGDTQFVGMDFTYSVTCTEIKINQGEEQQEVYGLSITDDKMSFNETKLGYSINYKRTSTNPDDAPEYVPYNPSANNNDNQRRQDMSRVITQLVGYYVNNRSYPKTQSKYEYFFNTYLSVDDEPFTDPDGTEYIPTLVGNCKGKNNCWGKGNNENNLKEPTSIDHKVYLFYNATCSDADVVYDSNNKSYALYYKQELGGNMCFTNAD